MKKLLFLAITVLVVTITSCSKDDDNRFEGTWTLTQMESGTDLTRLSTVDLTDCDKKTTVTFSGNDFVFNGFGYDRQNNCVETIETATFSYTDTTLNVKDVLTKVENTVSYTIIGNLLTVLYERTEKDNDGAEVKHYTKTIYTKK
ncbi:MAG: lipocalin family protein [Capnocytophaga sp.]|nr:lipocalin family protein [Capnocytophaga sp.]